MVRTPGKGLAGRLAALEDVVGVNDGPVMPLVEALMLAVAALEAPAVLWFYPDTRAWGFPPQHLHHILPRLSRQLGHTVTAAHASAACRALTWAGFRSHDDIAVHVLAGYSDEQVMQAAALGLESGTLRRDDDGHLVLTTHTVRWVDLARRVAERANTIERVINGLS